MGSQNGKQINFSSNTNSNKKKIKSKDALNTSFNNCYDDRNSIGNNTLGKMLI